MQRSNKNYYGVAVGRSVGIFKSWAHAGESVLGYSMSKYKGFETIQETVIWMGQSNFDTEDIDITLKNGDNMKLPKYLKVKDQSKKEDSTLTVSADTDADTDSYNNCDTSTACQDTGPVSVKPSESVVLAESTDKLAESTDKLNTTFADDHDDPKCDSTKTTEVSSVKELKVKLIALNTPKSTSRLSFIKNKQVSPGLTHQMDTMEAGLCDFQNESSKFMELIINKLNTIESEMQLMKLGITKMAVKLKR